MKYNNQKGMTLLEVMVSVFIVSIALLGSVAMLNTSVQNNRAALNRNAAIYLTDAIIDKIRMNRFAVDRYLYGNKSLKISDSYSYTTYADSGKTCSDCDTKAKEDAYEQAKVDLRLWATELQEKLPEASFAIYPQSSSNNNRYVVKIVWPNVRKGNDSSDNANNLDELLTIFTL